MRPRVLPSALPLLSLIALVAIGCAPAQEEDSGGGGTPASDESNQTSSTWSATQIGDRPNRDVVDNERVAIAIDPRGTRHGVFLGRDQKTHYVDLTANKGDIIEAKEASHHALALDPSGQPVIAFSSGDGIQIATKRNGSWALEKLGVSGTVTGLVVDGAGAVHVASSSYDANLTSTATLSTKKAGASAFEHVAVPGKLDREIGFGAFALAADRNGTAYLLLSSFESIEDAPNKSHSGPTHSYFAKKPAGGAFVVEPMAPAASGGSMTVDASGVVHAVLSTQSEVPDHDTKPVYVRRGPNDAAWSAPEQVFWDGYYSSLAVDASGGLHLAITGSPSSFIAYANRPSGGTWTTTVINSSRAAVPSIALDPAGKPLIAYRDDGGYMLARDAAQ